MMNCKALFVLLLLLLPTLAFAENYVVINSRNGIDVLSGVYYANAIGVPARFVPLGGSAELTAAKVGKGKDILLIQSRDTPANAFLQAELAKNNNVTVYESTNFLATNLALAEKSNTNKFIIVDPSFGQNALSALSYAKKTKAYVLFVYGPNADNVVAFLNTKGSPQVTIFGYVDSATREKLSKYSPTFIGKGEDKYSDNIEIVGREIKEYNVRQVLLSSGTMLTESTATGEYPVVLVSPIIAQGTYDFLKKEVLAGNIKSMILLETSLIRPVYDMKKRIEAEYNASGINKKFPVIVELGQATAGSTDIRSVDSFPLPYYITGLNIDSLKYNTATGKVELVVTSTAEGPEYYQSQIIIKVNGVDDKVLSDPTPILIERGATVGSEYSYTLPNVKEGNITADVIVKYGETAKSLTSFASKRVTLVAYEFTDSSLLDVTGASYSNGNLKVSVRNIGEQDAFVQTAVELMVGGQKTTLRGSTTDKATPGSITVISLPIDLTKEDLDANKEVKVTLTYGARQGFLQKTKTATVPLKTETEGQQVGIDPLLILLAVLLVILIIAVVYFATRKSGAVGAEKEEKAKHHETKKR